MRTQSRDTSPEAEAVQVALLRKALPARRFQLACSLSQTTTQLAWRGIQRAHPEFGANEVKLAFVEIHYGRELANALRNHLIPEVTMKASDMNQAITPVVKAFHQLGIPYFIGGSVASSVYGIARATLDVDFVADLHESQIQRLVQILENAYYISADAVREALQHQTSFNIIHLETMVKLDVFILKEDPYDQMAFQRRREEPLEEAADAPRLSLASAEDVILHKLHWYQLGEGASERQWNDVLGVLKVQAAALDTAYLEHWAQRLGLLRLLKQAFEDAGIVGESD